MTTTNHPTMTVGEALGLLRITPHDHDMRTRFGECFVCGGPVNFMRYYQEGRKYCSKHDGATAELAEAIALLNR